MTIHQLPVEIIRLILTNLDIKSHLNLTATCQTLQPFRFDATYWLSQTRSTFPFPNLPTLDPHNGARWHTLYRRLLTQTDIYTWGSAHVGNLGRWVGPPGGYIKPMDHFHDVGRITDLQCGGWSTSMLSSNGVIFLTGVLSADDVRRRREPHERHVFADEARIPIRVVPQAERRGWMDLFACLPLGFPRGAGERGEGEGFDAMIAVRQYSAGRLHVLGLSDAGVVWVWYSEREPAVRLRFAEVEPCWDGAVRGRSHMLTDDVPIGTVLKVVAGRAAGEGAAYVAGRGIVVWNDMKRDDGSKQYDRLVDNATVIQSTGFKKEPTDTSVNEQDPAAQIGAVLDFIMLENYTVFITNLGRVYASYINGIGPEERLPAVFAEPPFELSHLRCHDYRARSKFSIQGSFRTFGVIADSKVIIQTQDDLDRKRTTSLSPTSDQNSRVEADLIPSLQNTGVVQLAFGDSHFHAVHADGSITSHGQCSAGHDTFGFGADLLRGVRGSMVMPEAERIGRRVWFDEARQRWIRGIIARSREEATERIRAWRSDRNMMVAVSDHIEESALSFERSFAQGDAEVNEDNDGLGPAFAMAVAASGAHSAALVLVNEPMMQRMNAMSEKNLDLSWGFPKLV